jgi:transcription elongation GreA/GreB family factor
VERQEGWSANDRPLRFLRTRMDERAALEKRRKALEERRARLQHRIVDLEQAVAAAKADASALSDLRSARAQLLEVIEALRHLEVGEGHDPNVVEVGDTVTVREQVSSETERYKIVGPVEARMDDSWISTESPLVGPAGRPDDHRRRPRGLPSVHRCLHRADPEKPGSNRSSELCPQGRPPPRSLPCMPQKCRKTLRNEHQPIRTYRSRPKGLTRAFSNSRRWVRRFGADS